MSKVTAIKPGLHGHKYVELSNNHGFTVKRGDPLPQLGDEYTETYPPKRVVSDVVAESVLHPSQVIKPKESEDAVHGSHAQVEGGAASLGQQEGAASKEPEAGGGDHAVGEAGGEKGQEGIPGQS